MYGGWGGGAGSVSVCPVQAMTRDHPVASRTLYGTPGQSGGVTVLPTEPRGHTQSLAHTIHYSRTRTRTVQYSRVQAAVRVLRTQQQPPPVTSSQLSHRPGPADH